MKYSLVLLAAGTLVLSMLAHTQVPKKLSYQGLLTTTSGTPLSGTFDLKFELFSADSGGSALWTETQNGVGLTSGSFSVILGTVTPLAGIFSQPLYVQTTVLSGPGIGSPVTFSPRSELTSSPYALRADTANVALSGGASQWTTSGSDIYYNSGNVGIGTATPLSQLHVKGSSPVRIMGDLSTLAGAEYVDFFARNSQYSSELGGMRIQRSTTSGDVNLSLFAAKSGHGAAEEMRVAGNGNIGIGTTTPGEKLTVAGSMEIGTASGDYQHFRIGGGNSSGFLYGSYPKFGDGIHLGYNYYANNAGTGIVANTGGATSRLSLGYGYIGLYGGGVNSEPSNLGLLVNSAGKVGIGTANPAYRLDVFSNSDSSAAVHVINSYGGGSIEKFGLIVGSNGGGGEWDEGIYGNGSYGTYNVGVYGSAGGGTSNYGGYFSADLAYTGNLVHLSDRKFKENIQSFSGALSQIMSLTPRTFTYKTGPEFDRFSFPAGKHYGFIAQEVEQAIPDLVVDAAQPPEVDAKGNPKGGTIGYKALKPMDLLPILVAAMQEQQKLIEDLRAKVAQLEKK